MTVQPWTIRVIGTRFLVRSRVARANRPEGCQATPWSMLASGTTTRSSTVLAPGVDDRDLRERRLAELDEPRQGVGRQQPAAVRREGQRQGLRLAERRFRSWSDAASMTEMSSDEVLST